MLKLADMDFKNRFYNSAHWNKRKFACINENVKNLRRAKKEKLLKKNQKEIPELKKMQFWN